MGDFNARTSDLHDFSDIDTKLYEDIDIDENVSSDAVDEITKYGHDIKSISNDNKRNKFGKNLIESCKIHIMKCLLKAVDVLMIKAWVKLPVKMHLL